MPICSNFLFASLLAFASISYGATKFHGSNCDIAEPPADAGYYAFMGVPMRVHPAPALINAGYVGCQSLWSYEEGTPKLEMKIVFREGKPTFMVGGTLDEPPYRLACAANKKGLAFDCEPLGPLPFPSLPKDCIKFQAEPPDSRGFYIDRACR